MAASDLDVTGPAPRKESRAELEARAAELEALVAKLKRQYAETRARLDKLEQQIQELEKVWLADDIEASQQPGVRH